MALQITSNMDWCEDNYVFLPFVAEMMNTITSLPLVIMGIHGYLHATHYHMGRLIYFAFILLGCVGCGSTYFHATLTWQGQAADEVPMLWTGAFNVFCMLTLRQRDPSPIFAAGYMIYCLAATSIYFTAQFEYFFVAFALSMAALAIMVLRYCYESRVPRLVKVLLMTSNAFFLGGFFFFWLPESVMCGNRLIYNHPSVFQRLYFHSIFHICAGFGAYLFCVAVIAARNDLHGMRSPLTRAPAKTALVFQGTAITLHLPLLPVVIPVE